MSKNSPQTNLDYEQTVVRAFEEANDAHRVLALPASLPFKYDYFSLVLSVGNTRETYTFKTGGSGGTTVGTVVLNYTDSTRSVLTDGTITAV